MVRKHIALLLLLLRSYSLMSDWMLLLFCTCNDVWHKKSRSTYTCVIRFFFFFNWMSPVMPFTSFSRSKTLWHLITSFFIRVLPLPDFPYWGQLPCLSKKQNKKTKKATFVKRFFREAGSICVHFTWKNRTKKKYLPWLQFSQGRVWKVGCRPCWKKPPACGHQFALRNLFLVI